MDNLILIFQKLVNWLKEGQDLRLLFLSLLLIAVSFLLKAVIRRNLARNENLIGFETASLKRSVNSYVNLFLFLSLLVLWFNQIQALFVSLIAVAAALVIATKELIMNFTGGFLLRSNNYFRVGDCIEIDGYRGFVVEKTLSVTRVLEMGPEKTSQQTTGDIISIPNSIMLSKSLKNESTFRGYTIKSFNLRLPENTSFEDFEFRVLSWAEEICGPYIDEARTIIENYCKKEGLPIPRAEPRAKIVLTDSGKVDLLLKIPVKNHAVGDIEQDLFRRYVEFQVQNSQAAEDGTK